MKVLLILIVVCYVVSQVESQDDSTKHQKEERNGNQLTNKPEQKHIIWTLMKKIRRLSKSVKEMKAELSNRDDSIEVALAELSQKMDIKDDSIKAEVAQLGEQMNIKDNSIEKSLAAMNDKTINIENAIKDNEAQCGYRHLVNTTNSQTLTFDKVYVEVNDNGGYLNKQTGRFTAGKAGIYEVTLSLGTAYTVNKSGMYIYLKTSSGRYQDDYENRFLHQWANDYNNAAMSASRFMFLDENESIYLDYVCTVNKHCQLRRIKWCVSFYSSKQ